MGFFPQGRMGEAKRTAAQRSKQLQDDERIRSAAFDRQIERGLAAGQLAAPTAYPAGLPYDGDRAGAAGAALVPSLGRNSNSRHQPRRGNACTAAPDGLPTGEVFTPACAKHDRCYATPGASKRGCDAQMYSDMLDACDQPGSRGLCEHTAKQYARGLNKVGWAPYLFEQWRARKRR